MTKSIFELSSDCAHNIETLFRESGTLISLETDQHLGITDLVFSSNRYRRAHLSIVDARETKNVWMLHVTVFPQYNDPSPIYGFDIVAGPNKVSGAFHDFSIAGDPISPMWLWYNAQVAHLEWNKKRPLPAWAEQIFSKAIVAIGAVGPAELESFITLGLNNLKFYLKNVGIEHQDIANFHVAQNRYCYFQRQNPHTPRVLVNLGFTEEQADRFVKHNLFPMCEET
jgi:hypothetical protein